ncbi:unnamed protein product [Ceratitis capitata]|nr:unnamed protein product [Ceratitis capitata]
MVVLANTPVNATTAAIKNEIPEMNLVEEPEENSFESVSKEADLYEDSDSKTQSVITEPNQDNIVKESPAASKKKLGVRAVLNNSPEGKSAIAHYNNNKCLDMHYRKKVVRIVIGAALEKRMDMSINDFQAMNEQLLEIFPNESEDTFYVPRVGNTRARGMLYNKYINLSRNLRRNGLLEYKRQRTNTSR